MLTRIAQTMAVLVSWPIFTVGACIVVAGANALATAQAIYGIWTNKRRAPR